MGGEGRIDLWGVERKEFTGFGNLIDMGGMLESLAMKWIMVPGKKVYEKDEQSFSK